MYPNDFPVFMMLVGLPEKRKALFNHNLSFMRIFHVALVEKLENNFVRQFFTNAFNSVDIKVDDEAMPILVRYSSGMPTMMHEIGDAVFWSVRFKSRVTKEDALNGVLQAGNEIGRKYLEPKISRIHSDKYRNILKKLGEQVLTEFTVKDLRSILSEDDRKSLQSFLTRCKELGIIITSGKRGSYKFVNNLYPVYFLIMADKDK